jgi:hypothetical protein
VDIRPARHKRRGKDKESKRQDRLSEILHALPVDILPMTPSELGGYVTGILACPEMIPPSVKRRLKKRSTPS